MRIKFVLLIISMVSSVELMAQEEHVIKSKSLGYNVRYWVYVPENVEEKLPVLYVTDGKWYKDDGGIIRVAKTLIKDNKVEPHIIVLVDAFDTERSSVNRRNSQFLCNPDYVKFYKNELIPKIDASYNTSNKREKRGMLGVSFGGLNSMYFLAHANDTFAKFGIQSPAPHPCPDIYTDIQKNGRVEAEVYLSTGTVNDKLRPSRKLKKLLDDNGYSVEYKEVPYGHNWNNWRPLLDDILVYFFKKN